jgi:hypothetical protein
MDRLLDEKNILEKQISFITFKNEEKNYKINEMIQ